MEAVLNRHKQRRKRKNNYRILLLFLFFVVLSSCIYFKRIPQSTPAEKSAESMGRVVIIEMSDGTVMTTYEKYIFHKGEKTYYVSKYGEKIDITNGKVTYK